MLVLIIQTSGTYTKRNLPVIDGHFLFRYRQVSLRNTIMLTITLTQKIQSFRAKLLLIRHVLFWTSQPIYCSWGTLKLVASWLIDSENYTKLGEWGSACKQTLWSRVLSHKLIYSINVSSVHKHECLLRLLDTTPTLTDPHHNPTSQISSHKLHPPIYV
jgi:hypothetical protein